MAKGRGTPHELTDLERINLFVDLAQELSRTRLVQQGLETNLVITAGGGGQWTANSREPDEDDFRSMLMALRQLIAESSPAQVMKIYNLVEQHVTDPSLKENARRSRLILLGAADPSSRKAKEAGLGPSFSMAGVTPSEVVDMYLNGQYFHTDPSERAKIEAMDERDRVITRYFLRQYALEAVRQVAVLSNIILAAKKAGTLI